MPIEIDGKRYYRTNEALKIIGISKATWFRWLKEKKVEDVAHKDIRGWRLFTDAEIQRIQKYANTITIQPSQEKLDL